MRKTIHSSCVRKRMVGGGRPLIPEILGQRAPLWSEIVEPIIVRSVSAARPSEKKVQLTLIGRPLRSFQRE